MIKRSLRDSAKSKREIQPLPADNIGQALRGTCIREGKASITAEVSEVRFISGSCELSQSSAQRLDFARLANHSTAQSG